MGMLDAKPVASGYVDNCVVWLVSSLKAESDGVAEKARDGTRLALPLVWLVAEGAMVSQYIEKKVFGLLFNL